MTAYLVSDQGGTLGETRSVFNTPEEALAQAASDAKNGFGIPLRVEDEQGKTVYGKREIAKAAR